MNCLLIWLVMFFNSTYDLKVKNLEVSNLDSMHSAYTCKADAVLKDYPKANIKSSMLADAYVTCYKEYSIEVPLELALGQAQLESSFGRYGYKNNPYNIRSKKSGYNLFNSTKEGVNAYYDLMCRRYLSCRTGDELLNNFVTCKGGRYAESKTYEAALRKLVVGYRKKFEECNIND